MVHLLGWSRGRELADDAEVIAALVADYPEVSCGRVIMGDDGRAALVEVAGGLGLVRAMGVGKLTRVLGAGEAAARARTGGIVVEMSDFGAPGVAVRLADAERRAEALAMARRALGETA